jgi:hypothetical protein
LNYGAAALMKKLAVDWVFVSFVMIQVRFDDGVLGRTRINFFPRLRFYRNEHQHPEVRHDVSRFSRAVLHFSPKV